MSQQGFVFHLRPNLWIILFDKSVDKFWDSFGHLVVRNWKYDNFDEKNWNKIFVLTQGYRYHKLWKTFGKFFRSYSELLSKFGAISFPEYVSKGITHPVFYGDLVYKLRRVKDKPNFILSGSKIVKRLRRRQYDPVIIERTIGLVLGPFTAL